MTNNVHMAARRSRSVPTNRPLAAVAILTLALLWSAVATAQVGPLQTRVVVDRTYQAVVQIRVPLGPDDDGRQSVGFGSGTIVSPAGYVLTNYHAIAEGSQVAARIEIWRQEGPHEPLRHAFDATFVAGDLQLDLAVVRIVSDANGRPVGGGFTFFPIGDFLALGVKITDPIDAIGYPTAGGQSITGYPGTVSGFAGEFDVRELFRLSEAGATAAVERMVAAIPAGDTWIKTTAPFTGGISGGALLDGHGNLIGVPTLSLTALRLARPAILARPLLREVPGVAFVERAEQGAVEPDRTDALRPGQESEFVSRAQAGGVVRLGPGTFVLDSTLELRNTVEIIGAGQDLTTVEVSGDRFALAWAGSGVLRLRSLTVEYTGAMGTVIVATGGQLEVRHTTVQGGGMDWARRYGIGLLVSGSGRARVQDSVFRHNALHGVVVQDEGHIDFVRNSVVGNGGFGILFLDPSGGSVQNNEIARNDYGGLVRPLRDTVVANDNTLRNNGRLGALPAMGRFPAPP